MEILTKHFGSMEYTEEETVHFQDGLFGFEDYKDYVPIPLEEDSDAIICLQSLDDQDIAFIMMNPFLLSSVYRPKITAADRKALGNPNEEDISYYCICVINETLEDSTINLKCPIAVNALTRAARQLILDQPGYNFRHRIKDIEKDICTTNKKEVSHAGTAKKEKPVAGHKR
ncbi:MAG: flagellar assembly protein FliW [Lachnospiraceae bacterium]|jgi:flagellar assembly factor FliW|nr:flagellar assembly protein FliW [Lachnospiraceae bacterium]MCI9389658.1 flagellar assembly protein FliW [Lachnospiraceae bacterium]MCI9470333.1 flagellar assembly protein FliW [Lachnospiraceae bacterium]